MEPEYVHVSLGQFESTAISKLVARGVREDVARAFVTVGLRKQDGYSRYKEIVCKAKFHSFFVHRPNEGTMVPTVLDRKTNKFRAPYAMTGREKAEIISSFPELDVICDGTIRNPHAFYANKRLAECEMLISWVWATAIRYSDLDPKSIVDLGGNHTQHTNRGRNYVHCDTPVLSAKDIYRYTVREVYAGVDPGAMCSKSFQCCDVRADFGIAVHATYDLTPQAIADGMQKRGMKFFFGVINLHPMLASLSSGEYIHDGMVLKVNSDSISYSFAHDTSLSYTHSKYGISQYLKSKLPLEVSTSVGSRWYSFEHKSVRGSTIVFSISEVDGPCEEGTSMATGLRSDKYRIDLAGLAEPMEVDRELFDRAVLMAASSRKIEEYNITSLYKYVKSLRQRISINSIVLSSGFKDGTDVLVRVTVAALAVASAYHTESMRLFSAGSKEIMMRRDRSVFSDIFSISGKLVDMCVTSLSDLVGYSEAVDGLKKWAVDLLKQGNSVQVSVATVKDFGNRFRPSVLGSGALQLGNPSTLEWFSYKPAAIRDASFSYKTMSYLCVKGSGHPNHGMFSYSCFAGYGYANVYPEDLEITEVISSTYKVGGLSSMVMECKYDKDAVYKAYLNQFSVEGDTDGRIRTLSNGDSVLHVVAPDPLDASVGAQHCFVAFRGVGSKFVICEPPGFYTSRCLRFVLFFEEDISGLCADSSSLEVENLPNPLYSVVKHCASNLQSLGQTSGVVYSSEGGEGRVVTSGPTQPRFFGAGSIPPTIVNDRVEASNRMQQLHDVFENATEYMSDDDADDDVLNEAVGAMSNVSVGSGSSGPEPVTPVLGKVGAKTEPLPSVGGLSGGVPSSSGFRTDVGGSSVAELSSVSESMEVPRVPSEERDGTVTTDQFGELLRRDQGLPKRSWAGSDTFSSVSEGAKFPGADAMSELLAWAEETGNTALSVGKRYCGLAKAALAGDLPEKHWNAVRSGLEGNVQICHVVDGGLVEYFSGRPLSHMAVTDGDHVLVTKSLPDGAGPFVTYSDLEVWTVASIVEAVSRNLFNDYSCPVELVIGPAGCGKTTEICKAITSDDMGLCETREAAKDTAQRLEKTGKTLAWKFSTVDSFLINRASTFSRQGVNPTVLYLDEALRLHAGKIWCLIKVLRPQKVVCFGDPEQIPLLPFTPNFEFKRSVFPWSSTTTLDRTYRLPGDITMMLVCAGYYPYKFKTYSGVARGFKGVKQFYQGIFSDKPAECVVLTYTQSASEDLRRDGVSPVMTIGESQGKDLDHVWLFRESDLSKDIYYSVSQTLTAITRVKKTFTFVTVCFNDDSEINTLLRVLDDPHSVGSVGDYMH